MSKQAVKEVEFFADGELIRTTTDPETARDIGMYKDIYNKIEHFTITSRILTPKRAGFVRKAIQAQSHRLRIVCIKEYLPNVPEILDASECECGILNRKTQEYHEVKGGVQDLYYNLFNGRIK